jgi:hypothetical protein
LLAELAKLPLRKKTYQVHVSLPRKIYPTLKLIPVPSYQGLKEGGFQTFDPYSALWRTDIGQMFGMQSYLGSTKHMSEICMQQLSNNMLQNGIYNIN